MSIAPHHRDEARRMLFDSLMAAAQGKAKDGRVESLVDTLENGILAKATASGGGIAEYQQRCDL